MRTALFAALAIGGFVLLMGLGIWQLQRAEWKAGLLEELDARLAEPAIPLPDAPDPVRDRFRAVELSGEVAGPAIPVFGTWRGAGAGYKLVAPFETGGRRVLVDLGVAPSADAALPDGPFAVLGNLSWPEETEARPESEVWTALDLSAMAARAGAEPVLVVARRAAEGGPRPVPLDTAGIPDNHLGYAVQWFGLAAVWGAMAAYLAWRLRRGTA